MNTPIQPNQLLVILPPAVAERFDLLESSIVAGHQIDSLSRRQLDALGLLWYCRSGFRRVMLRVDFKSRVRTLALGIGRAN